MTEDLHALLRRRRIAALERRLHGRGEAVRTRLQGRLESLRADDAAATHRDAPAHGPAASPGPLAQLLAEWPRAGAARLPTAPAATAAAEEAPVEEAPLLREARRTWRTLRVRSQLRQSLAQPQEHAGPLNSGRLVLRLLDALQAASPAYLECLLAHIDVLVALQPVLTAPEPPPAAGTRRRARKRP
ncbi:MAG: DUF2894 domain-containing protein [Thermomonas sp.]